MVRLGVDIDGVLADYNGAFLKLCNTIARDVGHVQMDATPATFSDWHWAHKWFGEHIEREAWKRVYSDPQWWGRLPSLQPVYVCAKLGDLTVAADVCFITNRPPAAREATINWLSRELMADPAKFTVVLGSKKGHLAAGMELKAMVEDRPENLLDINMHLGRRCELVLVKQPWNTHHHDNPALTVVDTVQQAIGVLERYV